MGSLDAKIRQMEEAAPFIRGDPRELASIIMRLKGLKDLYPPKRLRAFPFGDAGVNANLLGLPRLSFLPSKHLTETLIQNYLDTFEKTYPLLDLNEFQLELAAFWPSPESVDDFWLAQLYMMLAVGCYARPNISFDEAEGTSADISIRCLSLRFIDGAEAALLRKGMFMTKPNLTTLRVLSLLAIGKQLDIVTLDDSDGAWIFMGFVMRVAMSMCLHIGSDAFAEMPQNEAVSRRRVWNTLMLLDATTCLDSGMPLLLTPGDYDSTALARTEARTNADTDDMEKSLGTDETYQNLLAASAPVASIIINKSNSTSPRFELDEIKRHDKNIRNLLRKAQACAISQRTVLEVLLNRCLLAIHQTCALNPSSDHCHDPEHCRRTTHESSLTLLHLQSDLHEVSDLHWLGELFVRDFGVAGLYVCDGLRNGTFSDGSDAYHSKSAAWSSLKRLKSLLKSKINRSRHYFKIFKAYTALIAVLQALTSRTPIREALFMAGQEIIAAVEVSLAPQSGIFNLATMVDPMLQLNPEPDTVSLEAVEFVSIPYPSLSVITCSQFLSAV
jgi:hypothetical protein